MKKVTLVFCAVLIITATLISFKSFDEKHFGGTASASGKVTYVTDYEKTQGRKIGDIEPIEVTVSCMYNTNSDAKDALKRNIENTASRKNLKITSTISYEVTSCED